MNRYELIEFAQARLDELVPAGQTPVASDILIGRELDQAYIWLATHLPVPVVYLLSKDDPTVTVTEASDVTGNVSYGIIDVPTDYLRFLMVKVDNWARPVASLVTPDSNVYRLLWNQYHTATYQQPMAAAVPANLDYHDVYGKLRSLGLQIQIFPYEESSDWPDSLETFAYVPVRPAEETPDLLIDALIWAAVRNVALILRQGDVAQYAEQLLAASIANVRQQTAAETYLGPRQQQQ